MSRQYTEEEVTEKVVKHIYDMIEYWDNLEYTSGEKLEGLAFSMLTMLDGCTLGIPKFIVCPDPHPEDKVYYCENNENYYPENDFEVNCDIAGSLHEKFVHRIGGK
jgi:hypothetical protein